MFSLYDVMRQIRQTMPIHTIGLGKVMSAGTLLLASGTKGERRIGRFCRVMIHGVISGQHGHLADIENELDLIASNKMDWVNSVRKFYSMFSDKIETFKPQLQKVKELIMVLIKT